MPWWRQNSTLIVAGRCDSTRDRPIERASILVQSLTKPFSAGLATAGWCFNFSLSHCRIAEKYCSMLVNLIDSLA